SACWRSSSEKKSTVPSRSAARAPAGGSRTSRASAARRAFRQFVRRVWLSVGMVFLLLISYRQVTGKLPAGYFSVPSLCSTAVVLGVHSGASPFKAHLSFAVGGVTKEGTALCSPLSQCLTFKPRGRIDTGKDRTTISRAGA